jgi:two-component system LytT family response regulator
MTQLLRAVIVDDEAPARERLATLLGEHRHIAVVAQAADVPSAAEVCNREAPDVVFLDVQLRGATGFDLLPQLTVAPVVIFVTAFDRYAVRAFEVNALDYLLKPIHPERLAGALARMNADRPPVPTERLAEDDVVALRDERGLRMVPLRSITHIESVENYTRVYIADGPPAFVRRPMLEWHRTLPAAEFLRVGRSLILQLAAVKEITADSRDVARVRLSGQSEPLTVARRASIRIRRAMSGD